MNLLPAADLGNYLHSQRLQCHLSLFHRHADQARPATIQAPFDLPHSIWHIAVSRLRTILEYAGNLQLAWVVPC